MSAPCPRAGWPRWPPGLEPASCPVFVANEHEVAAPPEVVWKWLCRADLWPTWFRASSKVLFEGGPSPELGLGLARRVAHARRDDPRDGRPLPWWLRWSLRGALHGAHQEWLEALGGVAVNGPPKA
ncbi:MAG: hypothetical protein E6J57_09240 [Deltaproteobacteria bacterium]|nr:MAG: hypothetical protein E6J57_09240 [Deltaproteobacteria bacterium]